MALKLNVLDLPFDGLARVFDHFPLKKVYTLQIVSKEFRKVIKEYLDSRFLTMSPRTAQLAFRESIHAGEIDIFQRLLNDTRVDVTEHQSTALIMAAASDRLEMFGELLPKCDIVSATLEKRRRRSKYNALYLAVQRNHSGILRLILDNDRFRHNVTDQEWSDIVRLVSTIGSLESFQITVARRPIFVRACSDAISAIPSGFAALEKAKYLLQALQCPQDIIVQFTHAASGTGSLDLFEYLWNHLTPDEQFANARTFWRSAIMSQNIDVMLYLYSIPGIRRAYGHNFVNRMHQSIDLNPRVLEALIDHGDAVLNPNLKDTWIEKYLSLGELDLVDKIEQYFQPRQLDQTKVYF